MVDIAEILTHRYADRSIKDVSASLGVARNTISKYVTPAVRAGVGAGRAADQRGRVGRADPGVVPAVAGWAASAGDLAGYRGAP